METLLLLLVVILTTTITPGEQTCPVEYYAPPANLQESCSEFSKATVDDLQAQIAELSESISQLRSNESNVCSSDDSSTFTASFTDCQDVADYQAGVSGRYTITPANSTLHLIRTTSADNNDGYYYYWLTTMHQSFSAYCDIDGDVGWTVIMRRANMNVRFNRTLNEYEKGFGDVHGDYWLGLESIHALTNQPVTSYDLWIELTDTNGVPNTYPYRDFRLDSGYSLNLGEYYGRVSEPFTASNRSRFRCWTSEDSHVKRYRSPGSDCYDYNHEGYGCWWYRRVGYSRSICGASDLNALTPFWSGLSNSISSVVMKLKRN